MWIPTGDSQLDSLLRLKAAVDQNNLLTGWTTANGRNGGYCSWNFVTCDAAGTTVEVSTAAGQDMHVQILTHKAYQT